VPVRVMRPRFFVSPLECSDGTRPRYAIKAGACSLRAHVIARFAAT
jgi:hypothetical protein